MFCQSVSHSVDKGRGVPGQVPPEPEAGTPLAGTPPRPEAGTPLAGTPTGPEAGTSHWQVPSEQVHPQTRGRYPQKVHPPEPEAGTPWQVQPLVRYPLGQVHPPPQCMLGDTGNKQAVRIPLECNLFLLHFYLSFDLF